MRPSLPPILPATSVTFSTALAKVLKVATVGLIATLVNLSND